MYKVHYATATDDKDWLLKYTREDGSPVNEGKSFQKIKHYLKNVIYK